MRVLEHLAERHRSVAQLPLARAELQTVWVESIHAISGVMGGSRPVKRDGSDAIIASARSTGPDRTCLGTAFPRSSPIRSMKST
jgi:hypothetical protein